MQMKYLVLALGVFASVGLANAYGKGRPSSVGTWIRNDQQSFNLDGRGCGRQENVIHIQWCRGRKTPGRDW